MAGKVNPKKGGKKTTMACYVKDKELFRNLVATAGLVHPNDLEADLFHSLLEDYRKVKRL